MAEITKFGPKQIGNPTPQWATNIFRVALYLAAITTIVLGTISEIPDHVKVIVLKYSIEGVTLIHAITKLFGITITNDPTQQN
jgi:hypothetical protein